MACESWPRSLNTSDWRFCPSKIASKSLESRKQTIWTYPCLSNISLWTFLTFTPRCPGVKKLLPTQGPQENALFGADVCDLWCRRPWPEGFFGKLCPDKVCVDFLVPIEGLHLWPVFTRPFFLFAPFSGRPSSCPCLGTFSPLFCPRKMLYFVEQRAQRSASRGAVAGRTFPQSSGRKFLPEICVKKGQGHKVCVDFLVPIEGLHLYHLSRNCSITAPYFWTINFGRRNVNITIITSQKLTWNYFFGRRNSYRGFEWFPYHNLWQAWPLGKLCLCFLFGRVLWPNGTAPVFFFFLLQLHAGRWLPSLKTLSARNSLINLVRLRLLN